VQIDIAVGTRHQQVIRVFDHERIMVPGDEINENLVGFECAHVSGGGDKLLFGTCRTPERSPTPVARAGCGTA
jgi:hypothetical protein